MTKLTPLARWRLRNPLRQWLATRVRHGLISALAAKAGISRQAVHRWLTGAAVPRYDHFATIEKFAPGVTSEQWLEWLRRRPKGKKALAKQT